VVESYRFCCAMAEAALNGVTARVDRSSGRAAASPAATRHRTEAIIICNLDDIVQLDAESKSPVV